MRSDSNSTKLSLFGTISVPMLLRIPGTVYLIRDPSCLLLGLDFPLRDSGG